MAQDGVLKKCEKCGAAARYRPRERRCKAVTGGGFRHRYYCWGKLVPVRRPTAAPSSEPVAVRPQDVAAKRLAVAQRRIAEWTRKAAHATRMLAKWQRASAQAAKRASMTDAEVEAERAARKAQAEGRAQRRKVRGISLGGVKGGGA